MPDLFQCINLLVYVVTISLFCWSSTIKSDRRQITLGPLLTGMGLFLLGVWVIAAGFIYTGVMLLDTIKKLIG